MRKSKNPISKTQREQSNENARRLQMARRKASKLLQ